MHFEASIYTTVCCFDSWEKCAIGGLEGVQPTTTGEDRQVLSILLWLTRQLVDMLLKTALEQLPVKTQSLEKPKLILFPIM